jgi:subfamily B ATP-binding cassette protein MsbA
MNPFAGSFHYFRIFRRYIGRRLYLVFGLTVATAFAEGVGISLLLPLLRTLQGGAVPESGLGRALHEGLSVFGVEDSVGWLLLLIGVVFVAKGALLFASEGYTGYLQAHLLRRLKGRLYDAYSVMRYGYYSQRDAGHFINVINEQVQFFYQSFRYYAKFLAQCTMALVYIVFAFLLAWHFALMAVAAGLLLLLAFRLLSSYVRRQSRRRAAEMGVLNKLLIQVLHGFKYIVSTGETQRLRPGITRSIGKLTGYELRMQLAAAFTQAIREPLAVVLIIGIILVQLFVFQQPLVPIFVAIVLFYRGLSAAVSIQGNWQQSMNFIGAVELIDSEFQRLATHREPTGPTELGPLAEGLELRAVSFEYAASSPVLHGVDVRIPHNTTVAVVGESGAGKSTLIDLLTLLLKPTAGTLTIDGVPWEQVDLPSWRRQIGYVSQETVVFDDTLANNISLWATPASTGLSPEQLHERIRTAARKAHLAHFVEELPEGYETVVGDRGIRLSGGQRQRLFIARELFKEPRLLILDEATSALDTESEKAIQASIDELKGQMTVVLIAHRLSTVRNVDYLYVLDHGRIAEEGTYAELRGREDGRFREMVELQTL